MKIHNLALMLLVVAAAGCHDAVEPPPFAGTFALSTLLDGKVLPVGLYVQSTRTTILSLSEVYADTLVVKADGTWQERTTYRFTENPETAPVVTFPAATGTGTWTLSNGELTFTRDAGVGALLYNLAMQPSTPVNATGAELTLQNVVQFSMDWKPRFERIP